MATVIGFSARKGDNLFVQESIEEVRESLLPNSLTTGGLCQLTRIPRRLEMDFEPVTVYVNPARIAFLHEAIEQ
jgi:hypothetical protein